MYCSAWELVREPAGATRRSVRVEYGTTEADLHMSLEFCWS